MRYFINAPYLTPTESLKLNISSQYKEIILGAKRCLLALEMR
jgi:hypothetical protein